jgi:hypothetical protein
MKIRDRAARSLIAAAALLAVRPWAAAQCLSSALAWKNTGIASQSGSFAAAFDATPNTAKMDGVTGLSLGAASGYPSAAAIVRFNETGTIDVRNGSAYAAVTPVSYAVGSKYHFVMTVNPAAHTYSVAVTPPGGSAITLATNYAFRTEQAATASLNNWTLQSDLGTHQVCNFTIAAAAAPPDTTPPTLAVKAPVSGASVSGTLAVSGTAADNAGVVSVSVAIDAGAYAPASGTTAWSYSLNTAALSNGPHIIAVQAKDAAGNVGTASVAVTVNNAPAPAPGCQVASTLWQNTSFASEAAPFTASFSAIPAVANMDGVTGLSLGSASAFTSLAVAVRFNNTGFIDARNGGAYAAAAAIPYTAGAAYLFSISVNPAARTYSATVTPPGAAAVTLASNYAFRTGPAATSSLNDWALYADAGSHQVCNFTLAPAPPMTAAAAPAAAVNPPQDTLAPTAPAPAPAPNPNPGASSYNQTILADKPVMFLAMNTPGAGTETDLSGNGNNGAYAGGTPPLVSLPNGDQAADFNGSSEYVTVNSAAALSVPTSGVISIESWVKPDTLQFPNTESSGYVYWQGKGNATAGYEYANRMYSLTNSEDRPNRMSDYAWNTTGGLGSGAYFQDSITTTQWIMVTDIIDMKDTSAAYPTGYISIYKNGVLRGTVALNQYSVVPAATSAPYRIGTRDNNSYFEGAIGKVAVYNYALSAAQITTHYAAMTAP